MRAKLRSLSLKFALLTCSLAACPSLHAQNATTAGYPSIGKGARLFVTKSHPSHGNLSDADFRKLSDAGFTVAVSLWAEDPTEFTERAAKAGLSTMNWNLGLVDKKDESDQTITRQGKATKYTTPYSPRAWQEVTDMLVKLAKLSVTHPSFQGVGLDFEIYDPANLDGFCESYDDQTFRAFLVAQGTAVPNPLPAPAERWEWLQKKSLLQLYIGYQVDLVAERARALRKALDAVNPRFQIGVYGWGVLVPPVTHGLATAQAPALFLDATAYGRTLYPYSAKEPDRDGLKWTKTTLSQIREEAYNRYNNVVFLGGHYPQAPGPADGTQFKFTAKQAFDSVAYGDGYWIWTDWETPEPWKERGEWQDAMVDYFRLANNALDAGDYMWSAREAEAIAPANAKAPQTLITSNDKKRTAWEPRTGVRLPDARIPALTGAMKEGATLLQNPSYTFQIQGTVVEARPKATVNEAANAAASAPSKRYAGGHGLCALAIGDADGLPGDELVTLSAGWVKVWDIESQALLARFYVGADQRNITLVP